MNVAMHPFRAQYRFDGQIAVITGGAHGIGAAIAEHLHQCGATVVIWDLFRADEASATRMAVDITHPEHIQRAVVQTLAQFGKIDMLVNNAGFSGATVPLDASPPDAWRRIIDINLIGTFNVCHAVVPAMRAAKSGKIVNLASLAGKEGTPNSSAYSASKAGVIALTKSLGKELATTGVLVNAVAAAAIRTTLLDQMSPAHVQTMIDKSPMQRLGEPTEVAELVTWLCSGSCTFNTGAIFDLSGGRAVY